MAIHLPPKACVQGKSLIETFPCMRIVRVKQPEFGIHCRQLLMSNKSPCRIDKMPAGGLQQFRAVHALSGTVDINAADLHKIAFLGKALQPVHLLKDIPRGHVRDSRIADIDQQVHQLNQKVILKLFSLLVTGDTLCDITQVCIRRYASDAVAKCNHVPYIGTLGPCRLDKETGKEVTLDRKSVV